MKRIIEVFVLLMFSTALFAEVIPEKAFFSVSARTANEESSPFDYEFRVGAARKSLYDGYFLLERENGSRFTGYSLFLSPQKNVEIETFYREANSISNQSVRIFNIKEWKGFKGKYGMSFSAMHYADLYTLGFAGVEYLENKFMIETNLNDRHIVSAILQKTCEINDSFNIVPKLEYRYINTSWFWLKVVFEYKI
nr:hypothetical protein 30 [Elusimicrobiota bacterium]